MASNRLQGLLDMLARNPADSFARYGVAMEYAAAGELEKAVKEFRVLLAANPEYSAAYYQAGRALENLGRIDEARDVYRKGVEITTRRGDLHTRGELEAALDLLGT